MFDVDEANKGGTFVERKGNAWRDGEEGSLGKALGKAGVRLQE